LREVWQKTYFTPNEGFMSLTTLTCDLTSLFFPAYCAGCTMPLSRGENAICTNCLMRLPRTCLHDYHENRVEKLFWGRADILTATAFLHMPRRGITHRLIHELKYQGNREVGVQLGLLFGQDLLRSRRMSSFDLILPVPLHPKKEHQRGYNQCHAICEGMAAAMDIPWSNAHLVREQWSDSQTRKNRFERWNNLEHKFAVHSETEMAGRHILLVDDVITTGATFEACAQVLAQIPGTGISVAALALPVFS
jgi:ComF family protein